jgi:hypothetical protein
MFAPNKYKFHDDIIDNKASEDTEGINLAFFVENETASSDGSDTYLLTLQAPHQ